MRRSQAKAFSKDRNCRPRSGAHCTGLLQIIEIGRDGLHLRPGQAVRNRLHDGRCILLSWILAPLLVPIFQFIEDVVMELTSQTRKWPVPLSLRTVTESAGRNTCIWGALLVDFFPGAREFLWCTANGLRIEHPETFGESPLHRRTKELRHIAHDGMHAPVLNKGP